MNPEVVRCIPDVRGQAMDLESRPFTDHQWPSLPHALADPALHASQWGQAIAAPPTHPLHSPSPPAPGHPRARRRGQGGAAQAVRAARGPQLPRGPGRDARAGLRDRHRHRGIWPGGQHDRHLQAGHRPPEGQRCPRRKGCPVSRAGGGLVRAGGSLPTNIGRHPLPLPSWVHPRIPAPAPRGSSHLSSTYRQPGCCAPSPPLRPSPVSCTGFPRDGCTMSKLWLAGCRHPGSRRHG